MSVTPAAGAGRRWSGGVPWVPSASLLGLLTAVAWFCPPRPPGTPAPVAPGCLHVSRGAGGHTSLEPWGRRHRVQRGDNREAAVSLPVSQPFLWSWAFERQPFKEVVGTEVASGWLVLVPGSCPAC